jgi:hypothetical protein
MELLEGIMSSLYNFQSRESKKKGVAGQIQNIKLGYRAGGIAPYGYSLKSTELSAIRNGKPVSKTKLAPNPETAPIVQEYFSMKANHESRKSIIDDFYKRGIPSTQRKNSLVRINCNGLGVQHRYIPRTYNI